MSWKISSFCLHCHYSLLVNLKTINFFAILKIYDSFSLIYVTFSGSSFYIKIIFVLQVKRL
ncbi:hypothetical protein EQ871_00730 [Enterococcus casseliflavus]|nr:hypothetical protein EQ871_00730 [Enterococcus casseliflavus]